VSTLGEKRRQNLPSVGRYVAALRAGKTPPREVEQLDAPTRAVEWLMRGLRLDEPYALDDANGTIDRAALDRLVVGGLVERVDGGIRLTGRGRLVGGGVTAELLA